MCSDASYADFMNVAFYNLETTGISSAFDQPLQFAAILTDGQFSEIGRVNLRCRIAPHIITLPWALAMKSSAAFDLAALHLQKMAQAASRFPPPQPPQCAASGVCKVTRHGCGLRHSRPGTECQFALSRLWKAGVYGQL
jgi:hypothetical protein